MVSLSYCCLVSYLAVSLRCFSQICEDRRDGFGVQANDDDPTHQFVTYPQMTLTFWLHEPVSKAMFKIFGSLLLVLVLMLVG